MDKILYYEDELKDDFAKVKFNSKPLEDTYEYIPHNKFRKIFDFLLFHCLATPVGFIYMKLLYHERIVNKEVLKPYKGKGYFYCQKDKRVSVVDIFVWLPIFGFRILLF